MLLSIFLPAFLIPVTAQALQLENIRIGFHKKEHFTRIVLDLRGEQTVKLHKKAPNVFQIILPGTKLQRVKGVKPKYHGTYVEWIFKSESKIGITLEIKSSLIKPWVRSFILDGYKDYPDGYRLVLDLFNNEKEFRKQLSPVDARHLVMLVSEKPAETKIVNPPRPVSSPKIARKKRKTNLTHKPVRGVFNPLEADLRSSIQLPMQGQANARKRSQPESLSRDTKSLHRDKTIFSTNQSSTPQVSPKTQEETEKSSIKEQALEENSEENIPGDTLPQASATEIKRAESQISAAEKEIAGKQYSAALSLLKGIHQETLPESLQKRYLMAMQDISYMTEDYEFSAKYLHSIFTRWPDLYQENPEILKHYGESLYFLKRYKHAARYLFWYFNLASETPGSDLVLGKAAECLLRQGKKAMALKVFRYIIKQFGSSEGAMIARIRIADILEKLENSNSEITAYESPPKLYEDVFENNPKSPLAKVAQAKLASWHYRHRQYGEAADLLKNLAKQDIDSTMLLELRNTMQNLLNDWITDLFKKKKHDKIINVYTMYSSFLDPASRNDYLLYLAESYRFLGNYFKAIHFYQQATKSPSRSIKDNSLLGLAICWLNTNYPAKALKTLSKIESPDLRALASFYSGKAYIQMENFSSAVNSLNNVLSKGTILAPTKNETYLWLGFSQYRLHQFEKAVKILKNITSNSSLKNFPQDKLALCYFYKASSLISMGQYKEAVTDLEKAVKLNKLPYLQTAIAENLALICLHLDNRGMKPDKNLLTKIENIKAGIAKKASNALENGVTIKKMEKQLTQGKA